MNFPYKMVTGFPSTAQLNKAMIQNEVNFTSSSLPGYTSGHAADYRHRPRRAAVSVRDLNIGPDGKQKRGNPALEKTGIPIFDKFYEAAFGKTPSGAKYDALLLTDDMGTKMQRGMFLPKGSPPGPVATLRQAFVDVAADPDFIADYHKITGEDRDLVRAEEVERIFDRIRNVAPDVKQVLKDSIASD